MVTTIRSWKDIEPTTKQIELLIECVVAVLTPEQQDAFRTLLRLAEERLPEEMHRTYDELKARGWDVQRVAVSSVAVSTRKPTRDKP